MDNEIFGKFSLSFYLAVLFHFFVIAIFVLAVSLEAQKQVEPPFQALQAAIFEESSSLADTEAVALAQGLPKPLSKAEKKRLAREQKQAHRVEQQVRKKFLAASAQRMVMTAILEKQAALQKNIHQERKNSPLPKTEAEQANVLSTPALENPVDEQKKNTTTASTLADEQDV